MWRSGVCTGKDTGIKQTGRVIVGLLLVKNKPGYGQKKRADTPKMKSESQVVVDVGSISQSPRRLIAKYTIAQIKDLYSGYFALPGAIVDENGS